MPPDSHDSVLLPVLQSMLSARVNAGGVAILDENVHSACREGVSLMIFFTSFWLIWAVAGIAVELVAVLDKKPGDTLSEHVWKWLTGQVFKPMAIPAWLAWVFRVVLAAFFIWLGPHFVLGIWH